MTDPTFPSATNLTCRHGRYGHEECPACDYADEEYVCLDCGQHLENEHSACACFPGDA
jgi:hypothetical protein